MNKQVQTERIKGYFIRSACEILRSEGLKSISARAVAERAAYSYATLYNYFSDINDLVFECVTVFASECKDFVTSKTNEHPDGIIRLKNVINAYIDYFLEYPGIFELFFLERMGDIGNKQATASTIYLLLDDLCESQWQYCISEGFFTTQQADALKLQIKNNVMGMQVFFQNRIQPQNIQQFQDLVSQQLDAILIRY